MAQVLDSTALEDVADWASYDAVFLVRALRYPFQINPAFSIGGQPHWGPALSPTTPARPASLPDCPPSCAPPQTPTRPAGSRAATAPAGTSRTVRGSSK